MTTLLASRKGNAKNLGRSFSRHGRSAGRQDREAGARAETECSLARVPSSCIQGRSAQIQKVLIKSPIFPNMMVKLHCPKQEGDSPLKTFSMEGRYKILELKYRHVAIHSQGTR